MQLPDLIYLIIFLIMFFVLFGLKWLSFVINKNACKKLSQVIEKNKINNYKTIFESNQSSIYLFYTSLFWRIYAFVPIIPIVCVVAVAYLTNNFTDATKYIIIGFVIIYAISLIFLIYFFKPKNYSSSLKKLEELQSKMEKENISEITKHKAEIRYWLTTLVSNDIYLRNIAIVPKKFIVVSIQILYMDKKNKLDQNKVQEIEQLFSLYF